MSEKKIDFSAIVGIIVTVIGILYTFNAFALPKATIGNPMAPLYFPIALGLALSILGIILIIRSDFSKIKPSIRFIKDQTQEDKRVTYMITMTCISGIVYGKLFELFGFIISTSIFLMSILLMTNPKKYVQNTVISVVFSGSVYALFKFALGIPLPELPF